MVVNITVMEEVIGVSPQDEEVIGVSLQEEQVAVDVTEYFKADISDEDMEKILDEVTKRVTTDAAHARISTVTIFANEWVGTASPYSQVVRIDGVTEKTQVDLTPSAEQLAIFYEKDLAFVTENEDGVVTVYAVGQKPENDYTIQVTMTEVTT